MKKNLTKIEINPKAEKDHNIGIGNQTPVKKLDIQGYNKIDTILIRIICWYFSRKNIQVIFLREPKVETIKIKI